MKPSVSAKGFPRAFIHCHSKRRPLKTRLRGQTRRVYLRCGVTPFARAAWKAEMRARTEGCALFF